MKEQWVIGIYNKKPVLSNCMEFDRLCLAKGPGKGLIVDCVIRQDI